MGYGRLGRVSTLPLVVAVSALHLAVSLWLTRGAVPLPPDTLQYAEVARSLVQGAGYTINMVVFHPGYYPTVRHVPEMHGLLQPLLLVPLFLVFGPIGALSRVPGLLFLCGLSVVSFRLARTLFGSLAGVIAAAWLLTSGSFLFRAILGADDVGAALFSTVATLAFVEALETGRRRWLLVCGLAAGAATLEKLTGVVLPLALSVAIVSVPSARRFVGLRGFATLAAPTAVAVALYCARNYLVHGGLGFRFSGVDWEAKDDPSRYFAFHEQAPSTIAVWARLGARRVLGLVLAQARVLVVGTAEAPFSTIGGLLALGWSWRRRPAFAVLGLSYAGAMGVVVCVAYHVEMRYLLVLQPIFAVALGGALAAALSGLLDRTPRAAHPAVTVAALLAAALLVGRAVIEQVDVATRTAKAGPEQPSCEGTDAYLRAHVGASDVVMTANPWLVAWDLNRAAVNVPTNYPQAMVGVIRHYGARWALVGARTTGTADVAGALRWLARSRSGIVPLLAYEEADCALYSLAPEGS